MLLNFPHWIFNGICGSAMSVNRVLQVTTEVYEKALLIGVINLPFITRESKLIYFISKKGNEAIND